MKRLIAPAILCLLLLFVCHTSVYGQDMDTALSKMTENLATMIKAHDKKKIAVLDFTDLQGTATELGRYVAEQVTVDMVMNSRPFSVMDRANLKSILAEHKLTGDRTCQSRER